MGWMREVGYIFFIDAGVCGLDFESVCGIYRRSRYEFGCSVCEGNVFAHENDEATTNSVCFVESESSVIQKRRCMVSFGVKFSFLNQWCVYVVCVWELCEFCSFGYVLINI